MSELRPPTAAAAAARVIAGHSDTYGPAVAESAGMRVTQQFDTYEKALG